MEQKLYKKFSINMIISFPITEKARNLEEDFMLSLMNGFLLQGKTKKEFVGR